MRKLIGLFYVQFCATCALFILTIIFIILASFIDFELMATFAPVGFGLTYFFALIWAIRISAAGRKHAQRAGIMRFLNEISSDVKFKREKFYKCRRKLIIAGEVFHYLLLVLAIFTICSASLTIYLFDRADTIMALTIVVASIGLVLVVRSFITNLRHDEIGARLTREHQPRIFKMMDEVCDEFQIPHIKNIYAINLPNVLIAYDLGRKQHILRIGIHFLTNLSDEEIRVILKHEAMHIKNRDTFNSAKSYRKTESWKKMLSRGGLVFNSFGNVYVILITIYNDILVRFEEIKADENIILNDEERKYMTSALSKSFVIGEFYSRLYYELRLFDYEKPIPDMIEKSINGFNNFLKKYEEKMLNKVTKIRSITYDTHLSILERLESLGVKKEDIKFEACFNQENYDELKIVFPYINKEWEGLVLNEWNYMNESLKEGQKTIANFKDTGRADDLINLAIEYERVFEFDKALVTYERALEIDETNVIANLRKGYLLLFDDNDSGIELVRNAIESRSEVAENAIEVLLEYCYKNGMSELVEELLIWSTEKLELANRKLANNTRITSKKKLVPFTLNDIDKMALEEVIKDFIGIINTYTVKKINEDGSEQLIILLECKKDLPLSERAHYQQKVADLFIDALVFIGQKNFFPLIKRIIKVANQAKD